jgi:histidine decarboxylase
LRAPADDRWGYVTGGASEGTEHALWLARRRFPGAVVYHSQAAHHCVPAAVDRLALTAVVVRADEYGEIDYEDLAGQVDRRRDRPAIIVANVGTAMSEAIDDVRRITQILDGLAITHRWVHADAALSGIPLALLDPDARPGFDLTDGADSVIVSGHKFLGAPLPCGVLVVRDSQRPNAARAATYTGAPDSTLTNSRSGLAAIGLWLTLRRHGPHGLRGRAEQARDVATYAHGRLVEIGWPAHRHPHAFTVVLATPPAAVTEKWPLASQDRRSHIVCVPGVTREQIDAFITDLQAATTPTVPSAAVDGHRSRGLLRRTRASADGATVA